VRLAVASLALRTESSSVTSNSRVWIPCKVNPTMVSERRAVAMTKRPVCGFKKLAARICGVVYTDLVGEILAQGHNRSRLRCTLSNREDASIHRVIDRQKSLIPGNKYCLLRCGHCNLWVTDRNFKAVVRWWTRSYSLRFINTFRGGHAFGAAPV
jgi:hypothetical protein